MTFVFDRVGERMHTLVRTLYPLCRSITGEGLRVTLREIQSLIPIELHEVPTGTKVLDWEVPKEWTIRGARIETVNRKAVVDFAVSNLHVVGYSGPVDTILSREDLAKHVYTLPDQPYLVPYRTAYYAGNWGFCLAHNVWEAMTDAHYRVIIDSDLAEGSLTYGELVIPGRSTEEVLISVHCCHPSLANDNLSGISVAVELAQYLQRRNTRLTYRFLFIPATIGSITWLALHEDVVPRIAHGLVLSCVGDRGGFHYKRSRRSDAVIDRAVAHVLVHRGMPYELIPFSPFGYDERQYCSPGYDLPVGCLMRSPNGTFPEYHTSADNVGFVSADSLEESLLVAMDVVDLLERNIRYVRADGRGEPNLGRHGLYRAFSGQRSHNTTQMALLWVLNLADGRHALLDMAERSTLPFEQIAAAAEAAEKAGLIRRLET